MECFKIENLTFSYPEREKNSLENINITISSGEFVLVCGKSGSGKTTLLKMLKPSLSPHGKLEGGIYFSGKPLSSLDAREEASEIGFIMQNPDNQIVTDKVWHELAFGLESLGYKTPEIRARVSEMAIFFGIHNWFYKNVSELSGGQKQLLNLASVMAMHPSVLIMDEPTSQLDPIAAQEFLKTLEKINRELGTTIIITEHRLDEVFPVSDRVIVMDEGRLIADCPKSLVGSVLKDLNHYMYAALPVPAAIYGAVEKDGKDYPLTVAQGRLWLESYALENDFNPDVFCDDFKNEFTTTAIELKDVWFRYSKDSLDVIKGMNLNVKKGELLALVGGNGSGKTTTLSLISGIEKPYRGEIFINGEKLSGIKNLYNGCLGVLPQSPQSLFIKNTVYLDLLDVLSDATLTAEEKNERINNIANLCRIESLLEFHPYDLSGGEQQRAALAKVLLKNPEILLLDEPTKGMDVIFKNEFAEILNSLKADGVTILMVSHDIEFCAEFADRCALCFDGSVTSEGTPREFFSGKTFYTTSANRMARNVLPKAVLAEDVIYALTGSLPEAREQKRYLQKTDDKNEKTNPKKQKISLKRMFAGSLFAVLFVLSVIPFFVEIDIFENAGNYLLQIISIFLLSATAFCFLPGKEYGISLVKQPKNSRTFKKKLISVLFILIAVPLTIWFGMYAFGGRRYYIISLLIVFETFVSFLFIFESRKPKARELVLISVLCAVSVAGRLVFYMLPQFKPVIALVIIAGVCMGGETGFLVGTVTGFVSNFFFGQGPWTPWQMFAFGIIGFIAGILFGKGILRKNRASLCVFGFLATLVIYGGVMNPASVLMAVNHPSFDMIKASYIAGLPVDIIHAISTFCFLLFISGPMIEKLERIKIKYGFLE